MRPFFYAFMLILAASNVKAEEYGINRLNLIGRYIIKSDDARFGGLSGARMSSDGSKLYTIGDEGIFASTHLEWKDGKLAGVGKWEILPLLDADGHKLKGRMGDAEGLELAGDGDFLVSFEHQHRIWKMHISGDDMRPVANGEVKIPMLKDNSNEGIEAFVQLKNTNILALAEIFKPADGLPQDGYTAAYLWDGREWQMKAYAISDGYHPTDAVLLPNGDMLVLERRLGMDARFYARIMRVNAADVGADIMKPELVAEISDQCGYDNMEGLAAWPQPDGKIRLVLVSDDNFRLWQKTYVVAFEYEK